MSYGNSQPPDPDAPVAPPELIGASLFIGLVAVVSISSHGAYLMALVFHQAYFDGQAVAGMLINVAGFAASLWYLALRRWAWILAMAFATYEVVLRAFHVVAYLAPSAINRGVSGPARPLAALGEGALGVVFLVVLSYISSADSRDLLRARGLYRARAGG